MFPHSVLLELIPLTMLSDDLHGLPNALLPFSIIVENKMGYVTYQVRCHKTHFFVTLCFETITTRPIWIQSYLRSRSQLGYENSERKGGIILFVFIKFLFPFRDAYMAVIVQSVWHPGCRSDKRRTVVRFPTQAKNLSSPKRPELLWVTVSPLLSTCMECCLQG
jgi:hypothetical protein